MIYQRPNIFGELSVKGVLIDSLNRIFPHPVLASKYRKIALNVQLAILCPCCKAGIPCKGSALTQH